MTEGTLEEKTAGVVSSVGKERPSVKGKPTILLLISHGWTVRNYVLSDFLPTIAQSCEVVICSPLAEDPAFLNEVAPYCSRVELSPPFEKTWLHRRIGSRRDLYHFAWCDSETMRIKLGRARTWHGTLRGFRSRINQAIARVFAGRFTLRLLDHLHRWCNLLTESAGYYRRLLEEVRPELVFSTATVLRAEAVPIHVAQSMGIKTAAAVLSWDNLSSKSRIPVGCDAYVVWHDAMGAELRRFHPDVRPEQILVGGPMQFDFHRDPEYRVSRGAFFRSLRLDPERKLIVYSGVTPGLMPNEPKVVANLLDLIREGRISGSPQVLVRLHPVDPGDRYEAFEEAYPEARVVAPGKPVSGDVRRLVRSDDDLRDLVRTLIHGDVHINVASTMTVDAAVCDRPVINVRYEIPESAGFRSPGLDAYEATHYRPVIETTGVRVADSPSELAAHINRYLDDPSTDREGRAEIVSRICGPLVGQGAATTAGVISELAQGRSSRVASEGAK